MRRQWSSLWRIRSSSADEYLARNVAKRRANTSSSFQYSKKDDTLLDVQMIGTGRCEVHEKFTVQDIQNVRAQFPEVVILAHPECSPEVTAASDFSGSTSAMIRYVRRPGTCT
jgi:quinolinate synthase